MTFVCLVCGDFGFMRGFGLLFVLFVSNSDCRCCGLFACVTLLFWLFSVLPWLGSLIRRLVVCVVYWLFLRMLLFVVCRVY